MRGEEGRERILQAALSLLIEKGAQALTVRRIAAECGLKAGNISYYFAAKEDLLKELFEAIIGAYVEAFDTIYHAPDTTAEERLERVVTLVLDDITTKQTTRVFPELWAAANHDPFVNECIHDMYRKARMVLNDLIQEINPALPQDERETLALFISASMEGMTIFAGFQKPWVGKIAALERIAIRSFIYAIRSMPPGEISGLIASESKTGGR